VDLGNELLIIFCLDKHDHGFDITEDSSAVIAQTLEIIHTHVGEVLHLDIRMHGEQAGDCKRIRVSLCCKLQLHSQQLGCSANLKLIYLKALEPQDAQP